MSSPSALLCHSPSPHPAPLPSSSSNYSSSMTHCPELDLSVTASPAPQTRQKPRSLKSNQQSDQSELRPCAQGQMGRRAASQVCFAEPMVVLATTEPHRALKRDATCMPQQPIRGQRTSRRLHHGIKQLVEPPVTASNQEQDCLERAEPNTILSLKAELQSLQGAEFNSQKAIQETLRKSERSKKVIDTRATEVVNVSRSEQLFTSLVSVDVKEDQLISQVLQDRLVLAPSTRCQSNKATDSPSLLPFMTSDLLRQKPLPPEEGPLKYKPRPQRSPAIHAFDLFKRWTVFEATP